MAGVVIILIISLWVVGNQSLPGADRYLYYAADTFQPGKIAIYPMPARKGLRMFIINNDGNYLALIARDPLDRCPVAWNPKEKLFVSPCKGGAYAVDGSWVRGEAERGLDRFYTSIEGDMLVVDTETIIPGTPRSNSP